MKLVITLLSLLSISSTVFAEANAGKKTTYINPPEAVYTQITGLFQEFNESIGGFSYEISLQSLDCAVSATDGSKASKGATKAECTATNYDGKNKTVSGTAAKEVVLTLIANGAKVDSKSEAGTAYVSVKDLNCSVIEPRSNDPSQVVEPVYACEANLK